MDWLSTLLQVGSAALGSGGGAAKSGGGGSYWPALLSGLGNIASSFQAVPNPGASRKDYEKANRINLLAGLFGSGLSAAGGIMQKNQESDVYSSLADILSGKQTFSGQAIPGQAAGISPTEGVSPVPGQTVGVPPTQDMPYGVDGMVPPQQGAANVPLPTPTPAIPTSTAQRIFELAKQYPSMSKQLLEMGIQQRAQEEESALKRAEILRKAAGVDLSKYATAMEVAKNAGIDPALRSQYAQGLLRPQEEANRAAIESIYPTGRIGPLSGLISPMPQPVQAEAPTPKTVESPAPTTVKTPSASGYAEIPKGLSQGELGTLRQIGVIPPTTAQEEPTAPQAPKAVQTPAPTETPTGVPTQSQIDELKSQKEQLNRVIEQLSSGEGLEPNLRSNVLARSEALRRAKTNLDQVNNLISESQKEEESVRQRNYSAVKDVNAEISTRFRGENLGEIQKNMQFAGNALEGGRFSQVQALTVLKKAMDNTGVIQGELQDLLGLIEPALQQNIRGILSRFGVKKPSFKESELTDVRRTLAVMAMANYQRVQNLQRTERELYSQYGYSGEPPTQFKSDLEKFAKLYQDNIGKVPQQLRGGLPASVEGEISAPQQVEQKGALDGLLSPQNTKIPYRIGDKVRGNRITGIR